MFKNIFRKDATLGKAFIIRFHVKPMENTIMPAELGGAYISCYSKGDTTEKALENCINKLTIDGLYPEEMLEPVYELEINEWSVHVVDQWPDYKDHVATQTEFEETILSGGVVYGPFAGYDPQ